MSDDVTLRCAKCEGQMERGFLPDHASGFAAFVSAWIGGLPMKSHWRITKAQPGKKPISIGTFRCVSCGYLESYARPEFGPR